MHTPWQQKLFTKLLGLQYRIIYKPGSSNRAADALSRQPAPQVECAAITTVQPQWILTVTATYDTDPQPQSKLSQLMLDSQAVPNFTLYHGLLRYRGRIWIGNAPVLHQKLIDACHSSALGGHLGFPATYARMKHLFAWKGMKAAVKDFVTTCLVCQRAKPNRSRLPGLLQPLPVPSAAW